MPLILAERSERIMGCGIRVHRALGPGLLEKIYEAALCWELTNANLKDERQKSVAILYEAEPVGAHRLDWVGEGLVVVELKATSGMADIHLAPPRSYLKATSLQLALVRNFARPVLDRKRVVLSQ